MVEKTAYWSALPALLAETRPRLTNAQKAIERWAAIDGGDRVLDMDCGSGALLQRLLERVTFDPCGLAATHADMMAVRRLLPDADIMNCPPEDIAWRAAAFDVVLCSRPLSLMDRADDALSEIMRTLKPGGQLVLYVSGVASLPLARIGLCESARDTQVQQLLTAHGFTHIEWHGGGFRSRVAVAFKGNVR